MYPFIFCDIQWGDDIWMYEDDVEKAILKIQRFMKLEHNADVCVRFDNIYGMLSILPMSD